MSIDHLIASALCGFAKLLTGVRAVWLGRSHCTWACASSFITVPVTVFTQWPQVMSGRVSSIMAAPMWLGRRPDSAPGATMAAWLNP